MKDLVRDYIHTDSIFSALNYIAYYPRTDDNSDTNNNVTAIKHTTENSIISQNSSSLAFKIINLTENL